MKVKEIIKFAIEQFIHMFSKQIAIIFLLVISMIGFGAMFFVDYKLYKTRYDLDMVLSGGIYNKGIIVMNPYSNDFFDEDFYDYIRKADCIKNIAGFSSGVGDSSWRNDIKEIQEKNKNQWKNEIYVLQRSYSDECVFTSCISGTMELVDLKFQTGGIVKEADKEKGVYYLYLGSDYSDIEAGTVYYSDIWKCNVIVAGVLEPGQSFMSEEILWNADGMVDGVYSTDCMIFQEAPYGRESETAIMFTVSDGYSMEETIYEIRSYFKDKDKSLLVFSLDEGLRSAEEKYDEMFSVFTELIIVVSVTIIIIQSCVCISNYISRKKYYGILYANGSTVKDIIWILIIQNMIVFIMAGIIGIAVGVLVLKNTDVMIGMVIKYVFARTGVVVLLILLVSIIAPTIYISRQKVIDLIYH